MNRVIKKAFGTTRPKDIFLDLLTFDRLMTKPVIHIIYWAGLGLIALGLFGVIGGAIGIAIREDAPWGWFLALPFLVGGALFILAALLIWRSFCEFYVAIFRIADDLRFLRTAAESGQGALAPQASAPQSVATQEVAPPAFDREDGQSFETHPEPVVPPATTVRMSDVLENPFSAKRPGVE